MSALIITAQDILIAIQNSKQDYNPQIQTRIYLDTLEETVLGAHIHVDNELKLNGLFSICFSSIVQLETSNTGRMSCEDIDQNTENTYIILNSDRTDTQFIFENESYDSIELSGNNDFHSLVLNSEISYLTTEIINNILDGLLASNRTQEKSTA